MEADLPSRTAERAAILRAAHQMLDSPLVLDDPVVLRLLGEARAAALYADPQALDRPGLRELRAFIALRSRYAEDALRAAVARGVGQYIVLGAGLDSFAYRNPHPAEILRVFEVDHPATQAWKRARLHEAGIPLPPSLVFAPVDFERQVLAEALAASGFDATAPACIAWLGVTVYLTREAIVRTLTWAASLPAGSAIVFEYAVPPETQTGPARAILAAMAERAAGSGEPWLTYFEPAEARAMLAETGFSDVEELGPEAAFARYFSNRTDGLRPGGTARLVLAHR